MKFLFGFILTLSLSVAYAQTIEPTGGGGGITTLTANSTATSGFSQGQLLFSDGSKLQNTTGVTFSATASQLIIGQLFGLTLGQGGEKLLSGANTTLDIGSMSNLNIVAASNGVFGWTSAVNSAAASPDTGLTRIGPGVLGIGNGSNADVTGAYEARSFISASTAPATNGSCSFGGFVGGNTAGTFTAQGCGTPATAATAMVLVFAQSAPNGWSCDTVDRIGGGSPSVTAVVQNASTVTAASFKAITATGDVVQWKCIGY